MKKKRGTGMNPNISTGPLYEFLGENKYIIEAKRQIDSKLDKMESDDIKIFIPMVKDNKFVQQNGKFLKTIILLSVIDLPLRRFIILN